MCIKKGGCIYNVGAGNSVYNNLKRLPYEDQDT